MKAACCLTVLVILQFTFYTNAQQLLPRVLPPIWTGGGNKPLSWTMPPLSFGTGGNKPLSWTMPPLSFGTGGNKPLSWTMPPLSFGTGGNKPFSWSGKGLADTNGANGLSLMGNWKPPGTRLSFTGTGKWQDGKGFGGSVGGSMEIVRGTSLNLKFAGANGKKPSGHIGLTMDIGRRRRSKD